MVTAVARPESVDDEFALGGVGNLIPQVARKDLGEGAVTQHCRYFRDPGALAFLEARLR